MLALIDAEQGRVESAEAWAREALGYARRRFQNAPWVVALAHGGLALACASTGRLDEAERAALRGEQLRRAPQPTVAHAHALLLLAQVRLARSRLARAAGDLERAQRAIAELPDPGRLPAVAADVQRRLAEAEAAATADAGSRGPIEAPSPAELAVLRGLAAGLSRREIGQRLYICSTPSRVMRASCTASWASARAPRPSPAPKRSGFSTAIRHPGDHGR